MVRFLFIDPDRGMLMTVKDRLEAQYEQLEICICFTVSEGIRVFEAQYDKFDLIAMDIEWKDRVSCRLLTRFRKQTVSPLIVVSENVESDTIIRAYNYGADYFIPKTVPFEVLIAFFEAKLRKVDMTADSTKDLHRGSTMVFHDGLEINPHGRRVSRNGQIIKLTAREFDILHFIAANADIVVSPEQISEGVDGYSADNIGSLYSHMSRLRKKIEPNPNTSSYIHTYPGRGYMFKSK